MLVLMYWRVEAALAIRGLCHLVWLRLAGVGLQIWRRKFSGEARRDAESWFNNKHAVNEKFVDKVIGFDVHQERTKIRIAE